jgi:hypothetical protein
LIPFSEIVTRNELVLFTPNLRIFDTAKPYQPNQGIARLLYRSLWEHHRIRSAAAFEASPPWDGNDRETRNSGFPSNAGPSLKTKPNAMNSARPTLVVHGE